MDASSSRDSGHLMLITPDRVFYAGLLGRPRQRCSGAFHVYVALKGGLWLSTADGREAHGELAVTMPNLRHTIASEYRSAICVAIEPESVPDGTLELWEKHLMADPEAYAHRIRSAYAALLARTCRDNIDNAEFDRMCFGEALPQRPLDPRIARAIARIGKFSGERVRAWWFNPRTGDTTAAGEFANSGSRDLTAPSEGFGSDWVLILDDASKNYMPPRRVTQ